MKQLILIVAAVMLTSAVADARVWRPAGRRPISGDFREVIGDNIKIRGKRGNDSVPWADLSDEDREYVRSQLRRKGQEAEIARLDQLIGISSDEGNPASGDDDPAEGDGDGAASMGSGEEPANGVARTWTDINGNSLTAEFVQLVGGQVMLKINGSQQLFPLVGFSTADQQWIAEQTGTTGPAAGGGSFGMPGGLPGGFPGGTPGGMPAGGYGGAAGAAGMGSGGFPGSPGMSGGSGMPSGYPGMSGGGMASGSGMPGMPNMGGSFGGGGASSGMHDAGGGGSSMPGVPSLGGGANSGSYPGSSAGGGMPSGMGGFGNGPDPTGGSDMTGGGGFSPPAFDPPSFRPPDPPPIPTPSWGSMNGDVLVCENCGAEFSETNSLQEGDDCPNCSGGSSFRGGSARGVVKLVIGVLALMAAGGSAVWRKVSGR